MRQRRTRLRSSAARGLLQHLRGRDTLADEDRQVRVGMHVRRQDPYDLPQTSLAGAEV
jgi:hypothetical protein